MSDRISNDTRETSDKLSSKPLRPALTRLRFLQLLAAGGAAMAVRCAPAPEAPPTETAPQAPEASVTPSPVVEPRKPRSFHLPTEEGQWTPAESNVARLPSGQNSVRVESVGEFQFQADGLQTLRPDIFQPGRFSLFDVLVHVADLGHISLDYHFSEEMNTHVIDSIDGDDSWWYTAFYSGGWPEANAFRMDMFPYKNGMQFWLHRERGDRLTAIYDSFHQEVDRLASNEGEIIIPEVSIRSPKSNTLYRNVEVTAHDVRTDVLQPGVVTGLDAILSLAEQGELSELKITWYERIGTADPVDSYWLEQIDRAEAEGTCGFVYETGARGIGGNHIHLPSDVRATVSPEYALWFWICL
jgi:hypothetical protein